MKTNETTMSTENRTQFTPWTFDGQSVLDSNGRNACTKANGPLIAAAPELLDIAERWMQWATGPVVPIAIRMALQEDTRAAIARARSQSTGHTL